MPVKRRAKWQNRSQAGAKMPAASERPPGHLYVMDWMSSCQQRQPAFGCRRSDRAKLPLSERQQVRSLCAGIFSFWNQYTKLKMGIT
jgi:hypothetical protein